MSDLLQEMADVPRDFFKDGTQFINRCTKPDRREFIKISQAVGMGFLIMGAIGYFIKLSASICTIPRRQQSNNDALQYTSR
ncbi:translocation complex subunit Sss1 [Exophiala viscosa]|uniref:Translocation complex subunit Sss1 n=1 Tax=Exophiala viscosa TaxID=2486360 RepID=A0AAN6E373_9EURO|nr:translocation complex subunit Sss1 [Exophiala viscosa]